MRLAIVGGTVFDPRGDVKGQERDLYVADGRLVEHLPAVDRVINARGLAVTPAGLDIRSSVARFGQNYLRLWGGLASPRQLGEMYAKLGYTHIHEPCLTFQTASYVHEELAAIPVVDTSASLVVNLRDFDLWLKDPAKYAEVGEAWAYLLDFTRSLNLRVVEPFVRFRQDFYRHRTLSEAEVVERLLAVINQSRLRFTLEATPELLSLDLPIHPGLHLGGLGVALTEPALLDKTLQLLAAGLAADMGLLPPSSPPGLPALPVQVDLGWFQPFELQPALNPALARRALSLAVQGRQYSLAFSVASVLQTPIAKFPRVFSWLGDVASRRRDWGEGLPTGEYTLSDWLRATRTLPAQYLGFADRGHLQPGARADIACYDLPISQSWPEACRRCRLLLKAGEVVVQDYELVAPAVAKATYYRRTPAVPNQLVREICQNRSFRRENLQVGGKPHLHWQPVA